MAFNTTQTILSTVLQHYVGSVSHVEYDLGMASLMIMYVTTCPSLYAIPAVIRSLGAVVTMMLGGLCYAVYIISLIYIWEPTVILSSAVVGFGQAAIWVSQGVILTSSSDEATRGTDAGLFWGIYSASGIAGPAFGYVVYQGIDSQGFFLFASVCTLVGVFIFRLLAKRQRGERASTSSRRRSTRTERSSAFTETPGASILCANLKRSSTSSSLWAHWNAGAMCLPTRRHSPSAAQAVSSSASRIWLQPRAEWHQKSIRSIISYAGNTARRAPIGAISITHRSNLHRSPIERMLARARFVAPRWCCAGGHRW
jgi:hypothetical protein